MAPHSSTLAWKIPWTEGGAWQAAVHEVAKSQKRLSDFTFTFHFPALEREMATHSGVLAWRIPGTGQPGGLLSLRSHRCGHDTTEATWQHQQQAPPWLSADLSCQRQMKMCGYRVLPA